MITDQDRADHVGFMGEDEVYGLHSDDDERTRLATLDRPLRDQLLGRVADSMMAHTDKATGAPVAWRPPQALSASIRSTANQLVGVRRR